MARNQSNPSPTPATPLAPQELAHYRDRLRAARYAALADAEGFEEICYALEALGVRLLNRKGTMESYKLPILTLGRASQNGFLAQSYPQFFTKFEALYVTVQTARNDAMHTGAYARHATGAAIELCIGLEDALMAIHPTSVVADVMVKAPVVVEEWQPIAHARQLMLMHSFSFLPVLVDMQWMLVSELGLARYLNVERDKKAARLAKPIRAAKECGMELVTLSERHIVGHSTKLVDVLNHAIVQSGPMLWLVLDPLPAIGPTGEVAHQSRLVGVLSPFELM